MDWLNHTHNRFRLAVVIAILVLPFYSSAKSFQPSDEQFIQGWEAYESGRYSRALSIWEPLARQGNADAQINLGVMYDYGKGVVEDPEVAAHWYRRAAEQGNVSAQYNLGQLYITGRGVKKNADKAVYWLQQAADLGFAIASYNLGVMYSEGKNLKKQPGKAVEWFYLAGVKYLEEGDLDKSIDSLKAIKKIAPEHIKVQELEQLLAKSAPHLQPDTSLDIFSNKSSGTAWPIAKGYAVTNNHVVANNTHVTLINSQGDKIRARVVIRDKLNDVALLAVIEDKKLPPAIPLSDRHARLGASVFTIGFPRVDVMGKTPKLTDGIISSVNGLRGNTSNYQISVPVQPGNSGGPLLNMNGEVVGIVTSMLGTTNDNTGATTYLPNISYALKVGVLKSLMDKLPGDKPVLKELPSHSDNLEGLAARIQRSVLIVLAD